MLTAYAHHRSLPDEFRGVLLARLASYGLLLLALAVARWGLDLPVAGMALGLCLLWSAAVTAGTLLWRNRCDHRATAVQLALDVVGIGLILALTGGHENPLGFFLLIPVALAAIRLGTGAVCGLTIGIYTLLYLVHWPLADAAATAEQAAEPIASDMDHRYSLHLAGMWVGFVAAAVLIAWVGGRLSEALQQRGEALARAQQRALEDKRLAALGAMAAGTAHELSSLQVLAGELRRSARDAGQKELAHEMGAEVERCRRVIERSLTAAGQPRADRGEAVAADALGERIRAYWGSLDRRHPRLRQRGGGPAPSVHIDTGLLQAIASLLQNAFEWGEPPVSLQVAWTQDQVVVRIQDRGPGIHGHTGSANRIDPQRPRGLGLFLAQSVIERHGGRLGLRNRPGGGTLVRIALPARATDSDG